MMDAGSEAVPAGPVLISVPHAGRDAPSRLDTLLRVPRERLLALEDRHVDLLAWDAAEAGIEVIAATTPRVWIDLNRGEDELDTAMVEGGWAAGPTMATAKVRGGLGLIPRRLAGVGDLWRRPLASADVRDRIEAVHRPYHARITAALESRKAAFGRAVLLDLHSMPPGAGADIVVGDLFGRSAAPEVVSAAIMVARRSGFQVTSNRPYAGGHVIERHGRPAADIDAIQLEIARTLYLKPDLSTPDATGVARLGRLVHDIAQAMGEIARQRIATAAEWRPKEKATPRKREVAKVQGGACPPEEAC